ELRHDGEGLGGQSDAGEEPAILALDHLLRLAHAGRRIAGSILDQELDLLAEPATLGILQLGVELSTSLLLLADGPQWAGQGQRHTELDCTGSLRLRAGPEVRCGQSSTGAPDNCTA